MDGFVVSEPNHPDDPWTEVDVPKECIDRMLNEGAVMKMRMSAASGSQRTQITMRDEGFTHEDDAYFERPKNQY
jgi:hypothetical protein